VLAQVLRNEKIERGSEHRCGDGRSLGDLGNELLQGDNGTTISAPAPAPT